MNAEKMVKLSEEDLMCIVGGGEETFKEGFIEGLKCCDMLGFFGLWHNDWSVPACFGGLAAGTIKTLSVFGAGYIYIKRKEIANWFKEKFKR